MEISVVYKKNVLTFSDLKWVLPVDMKLSRWSQLDNLLTRYKFTTDYPCNEVDPQKRVDNYLKQCLEILGNAFSIAGCCDYIYTHNLEILMDQLKQITNRKNRYSSGTIIMAFMFYCQSPATYEIIRKFFILPHKRYLQYLSSNLDISPQQNLSNEHYLSNISASLSPREKVVVLLIDEIYITSRLDYRAKNIIGYASNSNEVAKTILAFMICSAFGSFSEIVKLLPVHNITGNEMVPITLAIINLIQKCGFEVLCIITDNHRINRNMFNKITNNGTYFPNPINTNKKIFVTYDFVHLFKNIRNNWLNLKNLDLAFVFPDFDTSEVKIAKFKDLRDVYNSEKHQVVKKAFKLNYKSLYPTNLERQKVYLADNIFHHTTIATMKDLKYNSTAHFLEIIRNWWDIVNNTSTYKGIVKRNEFSKPITSDPNDFRVKFLRNFLIWLDKWHRLETNGHLTKDTYGALRHSSSVLLDLVDYCFKNFEITYILPGKFTTEKLEKRFGIYRLLCGCNYNVSYDDVINAEKKIRLKHIFKKSGSSFSFAEIQKKFENPCETQQVYSFDDSSIDVSKFIDVLNTDYLADSEVDESVKIYISGYASHTISRKLNCEFCKSVIVEDKGLSIGNEYFDNLQRGGLSVPTI